MFSAQLSMFWLAIGFSALVKSEGADVKELRAYGPGGPLDPITECGDQAENLPLRVGGQTFLNQPTAFFGGPFGNYDPNCTNRPSRGTASLILRICAS